MDNAEYNLKGLKWAHCWLADKSENIIIKHVICPILFLLPPTIATYIILGEIEISGDIVTSILNTIEGFTHFPYPKIIVLGLLFAYGCLVQTLIIFIREKAPQRDALSKELILNVIASINGVVSDKTKRMSDFVEKNGGKKGLQSKDIFPNITQPDVQLYLLTAAIKSVFSSIDKKTNYRVCLYEIKNERPTERVAFCPISKPPRTKVDVLSSPTSTIMNAIKEKKMVLIEDIQAELNKKNKSDRKYVRGSTNDEDGSQLCYPVFHPSNKEIAYVISINGDRKKCLEKHKEVLYKWIIGHMDIRISLEHSLLTLKEKVHDGAGQHTAMGEVCT